MKITEINFIVTDGTSINPLVHSVHYKGRLTKILFLEGILKKISYERREYESVDEKILSFKLCDEKQRKKDFMQ